MSKEMRSLVLMVSLPFGVAALLLAAGLAWRAFMPVPALADGAGASGKDGFTLTTVDAGGGTQYLCMSSYAPYVASGKGEMRQFLTFYEIKKQGADGEARLFLVGSRCVDFDRGYAELNFKSPRGYNPVELKKLQDKLAAASRAKDAANEPAENAPARNDIQPGNAPSNG